jgi:hypothetical protein
LISNAAGIGCSNLSENLEEQFMKRHITLAVAALILVVNLSGKTQAEVKTVQMKIAGYLCGN